MAPVDNDVLIAAYVFMGWGAWMMLVGFSTSVFRRVILTHYMWLMGPLVLPVIAMFVAAMVHIGELNADLILMAYMLLLVVLVPLTIRQAPGSIVVLNATHEQFADTVDGVLRELNIDWGVDDEGRYVLQPSGVVLMFTDAVWISSASSTQSWDEHGIKVRCTSEHRPLVRGLVRDLKRAFWAQRGTRRWRWGFVMGALGLFLAGFGWIMYVT